MPSSTQVYMYSPNGVGQQLGAVAGVGTKAEHSRETSTRTNSIIERGLRTSRRHFSMALCELIIVALVCISALLGRSSHSSSDRLIVLLFRNSYPNRHAVRVGRFAVRPPSAMRWRMEALLLRRRSHSIRCHKCHFSVSNRPLGSISNLLRILGTAAPVASATLPNPRIMSFTGCVETVSELRPGRADLSSRVQQIDISAIPRGPAGPLSEASTISTALASEVGSVLHDPKDAFLRSVTFFRPKRRTNRSFDIHEDDEEGTHTSGSRTGTGTACSVDWTLTLRDPPANNGRDGRSGRRSLSRAPSFGRSQPKLIIDDVGGVVTLSSIKSGDELKSINGKKIGPSYNADRAMMYMDQCWEQDGYLSVAVGNDEGDDILVQVTVVKPRPDMTYEEMGMIVWKWGVLCIKEISKDSIFKNTVLKEADHIISVNDIVCDKMKPEDFAHVVNELPKEIHILVRRGKQRWSGKFG